MKVHLCIKKQKFFHTFISLIVKTFIERVFKDNKNKKSCLIWKDQPLTPIYNYNSIIFPDNLDSSILNAKICPSNELLPVESDGLL